MRGVSKQLAVLSLLVALAAPSAFAAPDRDRIDPDRSWFERVKHFVLHVMDLEQLGLPKP
jgi:hypothetical protein